MTFLGCAILMKNKGKEISSYNRPGHNYTQRMFHQRQEQEIRRNFSKIKGKIIPETNKKRKN